MLKEFIEGRTKVADENDHVAMGRYVRLCARMCQSGYPASYLSVCLSVSASLPFSLLACL